MVVVVAVVLIASEAVDTLLIEVITTGKPQFSCTFRNDFVCQPQQTTPLSCKWFLIPFCSLPQGAGKL